MSHSAIVVLAWAGIFGIFWPRVGFAILLAALTQL